MGLSGLGLFVELWFGFFPLLSQQQAMVFLCQRKNMRAVSGDPECVREGTVPISQVSAHETVAGRETWHTADTAASSAKDLSSSLLIISTHTVADLSALPLERYLGH